MRHVGRTIPKDDHEEDMTLEIIENISVEKHACPRFYDVISPVRCNVCHVDSMKKNAYEVLMANLIQHATPLSFSLHLCDERSLPQTQVIGKFIFATLFLISNSDILTV